MNYPIIPGEKIMSNPYNAIDARRIQLLLNLVEDYPEDAELKIFSSPALHRKGTDSWGDPRYEKDEEYFFISVEVIARRVPASKVKEILSLPVDQLFIPKKENK